MSISWLAVVAAIVIGLAVAWAWYADWAFFGTAWRKLTGVTMQDSARAGKAPLVVLVASIVATAVALTAACAIVSTAFGVDSVWLDLGVGVVAWLGFSLSTLAQHNGFELKPVRLTMINSAYQLVLFAAMTLVIGLLQ
ncbi:MAG: DUF1761 domain-containing protein [Propionibacteriales bacterium]|nr:DUF1761 domain-containing protein [Propionibacteriales bacterium]